MEQRQLFDVMWGILFRFPVILVTLAGIGWAIFQWRKAPTAAMWTTIACGLLLIAGCIFTPMFVYLPPLFARDARDPIFWLTWTNRSILVLSNLCLAVCVAFLVVAVFAGRAAADKARVPPRPVSRDDDRDQGSGDVDDRIKVK